MSIVRELNNYGAGKGGSACLAKIGDDYFIVSSIPEGPEGGGPETLAFAANEDGEVTSWTDLAGGRGKSREDTIRELEEIGPDAESAGRGLYADTKKVQDRTVVELLEATVSVLETVVEGRPRGQQ